MVVKGPLQEDLHIIQEDIIYFVAKACKDVKGIVHL